MKRYLPIFGMSTAWFFAGYFWSKGMYGSDLVLCFIGGVIYANTVPEKVEDNETRE